MIKRKTLVVGGVVVLVILIVSLAMFFLLGHLGKQQVAKGDPGDIAHAFSEKWLAAALSNTTDPYKEGLANDPILSKELQAHISDARKVAGGDDPVLCQNVIPTKISTRVVYQATSTAEILITASQSVSTSTKQADVTLLALDGGWYINNITCSLGEYAPVKEFSFDTEGNLLKTDAKPLDPRYWYLVFEENGEKGHYAPLHFSTDSTCVGFDGTSSVCKPDAFIEATKAHVQGQMTELGVTVKRVQFIQ
jgi:hypothetical protein